MEELALYITEGNPADKHSQESVAVAASLHSSHQFASFRQADCPRNGAALTGVGAGERLFIANPTKALINVYSWGKEGIDQRIPVPEPLRCLTLVNHPSCTADNNNIKESTKNNLPKFRVPWLLAGGSSSGRIYIWELSSGNLLCVKDAHYQSISSIKFSSCGTFLVSGGDDTRCMVWKTLDLISVYSNNNGEGDISSIKPFASFNDHTLPITDLQILESGLINDIRLYTVSHDSTLRIYDIMTKRLLTTFVLPYSIECLTKDPANRAIYVGLSNGLIRIIPLYQINVHTSVLESIGGNGKIISLDHDPNFTNSLVHHQQKLSASSINNNGNLVKNKNTVDDNKPILVTQLSISLDGTNLISGDSVGRVFISDIVTRQVVKTFNPCTSAISSIFVRMTPSDIINNSQSSDSKNKNHRLIPQFKRVLASSNVADHVLNIEIPQNTEDEEDIDFDDWLNQKAQEELQFKNISHINTTVTVAPSFNNDKIKELEDKLSKVSDAYTELRTKHELLFEEHTKLLNE